MKKAMICMVLALALATGAGCGGPARPESQEPPAPSREISESAPPSQSQAPDLPSLSEESQPSLEVPPDPGSDPLPDPGPQEAQQARVEAMVAYLKETLSLEEYTEIWLDAGDGSDDNSKIEIVTPTADRAAQVVAAYPGEAVPVEYLPAVFSKYQLEQAVKDLEDFVAGHPDVPVSRWDPILLFDGYRITLTEESAEMAGFVESYPVAGIYQLAVDPDGTKAWPD